MKKKGIFIVIFFVMMISITTIVLINSNNKENYYYDENIISNLFEYEQTITNESIEDTYYYSDSYFKESSYNENEHLRTFSMALALAFNPTNRKEEVNSNLNKMYNELNFSDVEYYDLEEFGKNTIGTSIAHKKLNEKYDLVVVVLRGAGYQDEWLSNLNLGNDVYVQGFIDASLVVHARLDDYLYRNDIKDYKLLITGYSRAGAVAGLIGRYINEEPNYYNIDKDNLFVYTFESQRYSSDKQEYKNIHNVINKNDLIIYFYPESWGFYRNGIEEDITTDSSNLQGKYLDIMSSEKIKDTEIIEKKEFIDKFLKILPKDKTKFTEIYDSISNVYLLLKNKSSYEREQLINFFKNINYEINLDNSINILTLINSDDKESVRKSFDSIISSYDKNYNKIKNILDEKEYANLKEDIFNIFLFIQPTIREEYRTTPMFNNILTFVYNINDIIKEHYFSINLEQVKKLDSYYKNA